MLILGLLIAAFALFAIDTVRSGSLVSAGLALVTVAALVAYGGI